MLNHYVGHLKLIKYVCQLYFNKKTLKTKQRLSFLSQ